MSKVTLEQIQHLRQMTGVGMMDCKKALIEADADLTKAAELLRKKGAAVAEKRAGNATAEGLVHAYIHPGAQVGVLLELNCETDFVARTADVKQFAQDVCMHIAALKPLCVSSAQIDPAYLEKERTFFTEQLREQGKPEKMIEEIVEGKIKKTYADGCLVEQKFVKNNQITVGDLLKELIAKMGESIKIARFARFEIGA